MSTVDEFRADYADILSMDRPFETRFPNLVGDLRLAVASVETAYQFLKESDILHRNRRCARCRSPMHEVPSRTKDMVKWQCYTRSCKSKEVSIRAGTILEGFRFGLQDAVELIKSWIYSVPPVGCVRLLQINKRAVHAFYRLLRRIVSSHCG